MIQSDLRDKLTIYIKFRLTTNVRWFYISVICLSFHSGFVDKLSVGFGLGVGIGLKLNFQTEMFHVMLDKITVTVTQTPLLSMKH